MYYLQVNPYPRNLQHPRVVVVVDQMNPHLKIHLLKQVGGQMLH
jgi:hypothetical protein